MAQQYPVMYQCRQRFEASGIPDLGAAIREEFRSSRIADRIRPGERVGIGVGSRGVANLPVIVKNVVECFLALKLKPVIFPAMGSHGNANAEGQLEVLAGLGITEQSMGVPLEADMEVESFGVVETGAEVFFARHLLAFDHIFVINRVKPHTSFRGRVESGLSKMLAVGCGKHVGASNMHKYALSKTIEPSAARIIEKAPILGGLALVENAREETYRLKLVLSEDIIDNDAEFLKIAWTQFPRLPFDDLDILFLDEMGKNISGSGLDPNVIGVWRREGGERKPDFRTLAVFSLTPESHGNSMGMGMVDIIPASFRDGIDFNATYMNALTSGIWRAARMPVVMPTEQYIVEKLFSKIPEDRKPRAARVRSTLHLEEFWVSEAVAAELQENKTVDVKGKTSQWNFTAEGKLLPFSAS